MATTSQVSNIEIVSVDAFFGNQHLVCVDTIAADTLDGLYFNISSKDTLYYVWYNLDAGSVDPAPSGRTGIEVAVTTGQTAIQVADATATAVDAEAQFNAKALSNEAKVLLEVKGQGAPLDAWADVDTTFTLTVLREGDRTSLGFIDGDVSLALEEQVFDITTHQTGTQVIGSLRTGITVGPISLVLKETQAAKLKELLEASAATEVDVGASNTVTGIGALAGSKQFLNTFSDAKTLVLHPTKNADDDFTEDFCFWSAYPNLSELLFSGESDRKLTVDFQIFLDENRVNAANVLAAGLSGGGSWQDNLLKG